MGSLEIGNDSIILCNDKVNKIYRDLLNGNKVLIVKSNDSTNKNIYKLLSNLKQYIYELKPNDIEVDKIVESLKKKENIITNEHEVIIKKALLINREIEIKINKIIKIYNAFTNKNDKFESLVDLYSFTGQILNNQDNRYVYNNFFESNKDFMNKNKDYINEIIKNEINDVVIKKFIKYKRFASNHLFNIIKENIDIIDIDNVLFKLKGLLNNHFALSPPIFINKYTEDFIQEDFDIDLITEEKIYELSQKVYSKYNSKNIMEKVNLLWYKPSSWIDYFLKNKKYKLCKEEETKCQLEIFNEYKENIDNLRLFKNSFYFLSKVVNKEYLNKIKLYLLREDELWTFLNNLEKVINIYKEYKIIERSIKTLDKITLNLLEFCYKKCKNYKELVEILRFIPTFYKYESIREIESNNTFTMRNYHKIIQYIDELWITLKYEKEILLPAIELSYKYPIIIIDEKYSKKFIEKHRKIFNSIYFENQLSDEVNIFKKEIMYNYPLRSEVIKLILSLGYKVIKNYKLNNMTLDIIVVDPKDDQNIMAIYFDYMKNFSISDINYLLWLRSLNIKTIIIWSKDWWEDKNGEISRLKYLLNNYFTL